MRERHVQEERDGGVRLDKAGDVCIVLLRQVRKVERLLQHGRVASLLVHQREEARPRVSFVRALPHRIVPVWVGLRCLVLDGAHVST